jgi:hypothetical protein
MIVVPNAGAAREKRDADPVRQSMPGAFSKVTSQPISRCSRSQNLRLSSNLNTASALGLTIPETLLATAVIQ